MRLFRYLRTTAAAAMGRAGAKEFLACLLHALRMAAAVLLLGAVCDG